MKLENLKIAIVCDWLTNFAGAERVIFKLHKMFPKAPIYTSVYNEEKMPEFADAAIFTSFLQKFPKAKEKHQWYLPFYPLVFEQFDLSNYLERHSPGGAKIHQMRQFMAITNLKLTNLEEENKVDLSFQDYKQYFPERFKEIISEVLLKAVNEYDYKI